MSSRSKSACGWVAILLHQFCSTELTVWAFFKQWRHSSRRKSKSASHGPPRLLGIQSGHCWPASRCGQCAVREDIQGSGWFCDRETNLSVSSHALHALVKMDQSWINNELLLFSCLIVFNSLWRDSQICFSVCLIEIWPQKQYYILQHYHLLQLLLTCHHYQLLLLLFLFL